ncbi:CPBP family intramembrane metalloprotease [bacterium]|nr:CPBP family intramembrane metalloprotease [bacterium]
MQESQSEKLSPLRTFACLGIAFVVLKIVLAAALQDWLKHVLVALALFAIPVLSRGNNRSILRKIFAAKKNPHAQWVCLAYFILPLILHSFVQPQEWFRTRLEWQQWILSEPGMAAIVLAPLSEEFFFRGWLLRAQQERRGSAEHASGLQAVWICYINALVFWIFHAPVSLGQWHLALRHGQMPLSPGPFFLGFIVAGLTMWSGNLRAAIIFHMIANAMGPVWLPLLANESIRALFYN